MKTRPHLLLIALMTPVLLRAEDPAFREKLELGFKTFDANQDQNLDAAEFKALGERSPKLTGKPQVVDYLFQTLDTNQDQRLSHDEYTLGFLALNDRPKPASSPEPQDSAQQVAFFETKIRPVLVEKCYQCHSADAEKIKGGLVLDTREGIRRGGDSGPGIVPGDPEKSLVIEAIRFTNPDMEMPPAKSGGKLPDQVIADFEQWVRMGAADPRDGKAIAVASEWDTENAKTHWAWQPLNAPPLPQVIDSAWPLRDLDHFVLAGLEEKGLKPAASAAPETLLRRLSFALTGLPPTPELLDAFLRDSSPEGLEKLVDRLLNSPRFGERWGRHWLDVARYAESSGKDVNSLYPHAWRYRDYVIASFNEDKPFNEFIREQIAGDLLPAKDSQDRALKQVATGFLAIGPRSLNERSPVQYALDLADEQIDTVSQAVLGLTVACARCHDHKFDPIPQRDYYALAGIFLSTETLYGTAANFQNTHATPLIELPLDSGMPVMPKRLPAERRKELEKELRGAEVFGAAQYAATALQGKLNAAGLQNDPKKLVLFVGINAKIGEIKTELAAYDPEGRPKVLAMGVRDYPATPPPPRPKIPKSIPEAFESFAGRPQEFRSIHDSPLFARGDAEKPGERVPRGFVSLIPAGAASIPSNESGRRELAGWLTSNSNPLTARVSVNRVWYWLFGRGIVPTVDNFGTMGQPPSDPALLDHLAQRFQAENWSVKSLIKEIVLSRTYQMASTYDAASFEADPENALLWRVSPRRLEAECIRDAMLAVSGGLQSTPPIGSAVAEAGDGAIGGFQIKSLRAPLSDEPFLTAAGDFRSVYLPMARNAIPDALAVFDFAEPSAPNGSREVTTVPSQALYLLNNEFVAAQSKRFASRLLQLPPQDQIPTAFALAFSRKPTEAEMMAAQRLFANYPGSLSDAMTGFCRALFGSAEFRSID
jgi:hypothetical protein